MIAIYPGSFDPPTLGHFDIIKRAAKIADRLIVAVAENSTKSTMFGAKERAWMLTEMCKTLSNVEVVQFSGLLAEYARGVGALTLIRGVRSMADFEYEFQMAGVNKILDNNIETLFMPTSAQYSYLSSSLVKEVARLGGDVAPMVHKIVLQNLNRM